jgi:hypothetical protein
VDQLVNVVVGLLYFLSEIDKLTSSPTERRIVWLAARWELLFQPRRSVTAHRPGLGGAEGGRGEKASLSGIEPTIPPVVNLLPTYLGARRLTQQRFLKSRTPWGRRITPNPGSMGAKDRPLLGGEQVGGVENQDPTVPER